MPVRVASERSKRARRTIAPAVALVAWLVVVLLGIDFVLHRRFVAELRRKQPPQWLAAVQGRLPPELMRRVGFFENAKRSSFLRFPEQKPEGVTRVCAFGDSFTHGDEVDEASDYPSRLQGLLDRSAAGRFEVLNFGSAAFGFHQSYMMWDALGARYGCDHVLLGPATFFPDRDTSFNHVGLTNPYYLHARYVLDGDDVRLIEVPGTTLVERFEEYLRFVPHLDYARFDRAPPAFLRAALRQGQTIANPFYYLAGDASAEANETYRRLLRRLADAAPSLLVAAGGTPGSSVAELGQGSARAFAPRLSKTFPYRAARNHQGPMGNELLARQFLARLLPRVPAEAAVLRTKPLPEPAAPSADSGAVRPLSFYTTIHAEIAGVPVGHFFSGAEASRRHGAPDLLRGAGVASLLHVGGPRPSTALDGSSVADGCFVPMGAPLRGPGKVCLRIAGVAAASGTRCVGRARPIAPGVAIATLELDGVTIEDRAVLGEESRLTLTARDPEIAAFLATAQKLSLEVDGRPVLGGVARRGWFLLSPRKKGCYRLRANAGGVVDVEQLGPSGVVELVLEPPEGATRRVPFVAWDKIRLPLGDR